MRLFTLLGPEKVSAKRFVLDLIKRRAEFPGLKLFLSSRTLADLEKLSRVADASHVPCALLASDLGIAPPRRI